MVKKTAIFAALLVNAVFSLTNDMFVIRFSPQEWKTVKKHVDTDGFCRIENQSTVIAITNGLPNAEWLLPPAPKTDLERNVLRVSGKRGDRPQEPMPYVGQRGWR